MAALLAAISVSAQSVLPVWRTPPSHEVILRHTGFTVSYNGNTLCPNWVAWELTPEEASADLTGRTDFFTTDPLVKGRQAQYRDYSRNGKNLDRGHMAPSADFKWSKEANSETFYLTNICPQDHTLNEGLWLETEQRCRVWVKALGTPADIVCGPVFDKTNERIGESGVAVPLAFFKAVRMTVDGEQRAIVFLLPNAPIDPGRDLFGYVITIKELTALTGLSPFPDAKHREDKSIGPWNTEFRKK